MDAYGRGRRTVKNPTVISSGKGSILDQLNKVNLRCTTMDTTLADTGVDFMECKAKIYAGAELKAEGEYNAGTSTHAEMNALAKYVGGGGTLSSITQIEITAPPCKSCGFVLELLGLIGKVKTTKDIYKHFTGSWNWPGALQNSLLFSDRWGTLKTYFSGSGLSDPEILTAIVQVVRSQSSL
jgi:hypothetical protein